MKNNKTWKVGSKASILKYFLRGSVWMFAISIVFDFIKAVADMIIPQIIRISIDNIIVGGGELSKTASAIIEHFGGISYLGRHIILMAAAIMVAAIIKVICEYCSTVFHTRAAETLIKRMRDSIFTHIEKFPFSWHMKNHTGDIIQRCTSDVEMVKSFISEQLTNMVCIVLYLFLALLFMLPMDPLLTAIAFIPVPFIILYSISFHKKIGKKFRECDENEGRLSGIAQENLTGVRVVRAFGREKYELEKFENHNEYYTSLWVSLAKTFSRFRSTSDVLSGLQIMLIVVSGAVFCIRGRMTPGEYIAFISYNSMMIWPIRLLGRMLAELSKAGVSIGRIQYIMDSPVESDPENASEPDMSGDIEFRNVNFAYDGCPQLLHDINFEIKAGTTLGILGGTGSGKSTLMMLLDKLYDLPENSGSITVNGVDIRNIKTEYLRRNIGMVLQEPYLFSRTIRENIGITKDGITLSEIREAAKAACLDETVEEFTHGYDTFVGERGVTLSGGQKQRAAIARTLTQSTPIIIFDDSLSAVDTETDAKVRAALEKRFGSATIIFISHRITTLSKTDKIIVMDEGRIVEEGTPNELKSAGGLYQKIYDIQSGPAKEAPV